MAREFTETIFLGNGDVSAARARRLKERLDEGLELLGGLQQGSHDMDEDERERLEAELADVAADLSAALAGAGARFLA